MEAALLGWDGDIAGLESRARRELERTADQRAFQLHVELGVAYRTRGRFNDALREFDSAVVLRPSSSDLQLVRALTLEVAGRTEEADRAFRTAWTLDSNNPVKAYYVLQRPGAASTADRDRARALLTETYQQFPRDAARPSTAPFLTLDAIPDSLSRTPIVGDALTAEAFRLMVDGRFAEAVAALRQPGTAPPRNDADAPLLHLLRGQQDERMGDVVSARLHYQQALAGALVGRSELYVAIARLAQVDGDTAAAADALARAVRLNPNDPYLHKELAMAHAAQDHVDDAFCELVAALLIDPGDAHAHAMIGQLFLGAERHGDAVGGFTRALELKPDAFEARYGLATALARLGNAAEAARQLERFGREQREAQERRRRDMHEVQEQEVLRPHVAGQDGAR